MEVPHSGQRVKHDPSPLALRSVRSPPMRCASFAARTEAEATAATATVLAHVLDLLVTLLGVDLGMKPIRKLWPQATSAKETDE
jgi:hypothetical protein